MKAKLPVQPLFEPSLPDDFATRVIARARFEQRRTRLRRRLSAAGGAGLLAVTLALSGYLRDVRSGPSSAPARVSEVSYNAWEQSDLTAETYQLALATDPDRVADYLVPSAASLADLSDAPYATDISWQNDDSPWFAGN
jgi:hypothetical protein